VQPNQDRLAGVERSETPSNSKTHGAQNSFLQTIQLSGTDQVQNPAQNDADGRQNDALDPFLRKFKESGCYEASDKCRYAQIAEECRPELQFPVVNDVRHCVSPSLLFGAMRHQG
jgi:hypothetical protein